MSIRFPRLAAAALLLAGAITVGAAAPAFAENSPTVIPIAVDDGYSMMGGTTLTVEAMSGLLANDLHAADWTIIFVEAVQNDVPGELTLESTYKNGAFTYTPDPAFSGIRTFEYQVRDGDLGVVSDNWGLVTITVLDPTLPCAIGTPGCEAPTELPPCDPNVPVEAPAPGEEPTCIPGDPIPGDGTDLPCIVGSPGCPPPTDLPCGTDVQPVETAQPCIPVIDTTIPTVDQPIEPVVPVVPTVDEPTAPVVPVTPEVVTTGVQLETLAYTGDTVDYRLAGLAALLFTAGIVLIIPRRRA